MRCKDKIYFCVGILGFLFSSVNFGLNLVNYLSLTLTILFSILLTGLAILGLYWIVFIEWSDNSIKLKIWGSIFLSVYISTIGSYLLNRYFGSNHNNKITSTPIISSSPIISITPIITTPSPELITPSESPKIITASPDLPSITNTATRTEEPLYRLLEVKKYCNVRWERRKDSRSEPPGLKAGVSLYFDLRVPVTDGFWFRVSSNQVDSTLLHYSGLWVASECLLPDSSNDLQIDIINEIPIQQATITPSG